MSSYVGVGTNDCSGTRGPARAARRRRRACACLQAALLAGVSWTAAPVFAHAPPQILSLARSTNGNLALLTNRGMIFGDSAQGPFRLMCNEALGINTSEQPDFAYAPDGRLLVATSSGLRATADGGCSWQPVAPFGSLATPALAQDPSAPKRLYLATYGTGQSGLQISEDGGTTWTPLTSVADDDFIQEVFVAPSSASDLYYSGEVLDTSGNFTHYVARSQDSGMSFTRAEIALQDNEVDLQLLAVSPGDPNVLLARAQDSNDAAHMDRLLRSSDGGQHFSSVLTVEQIFGAAFSADGTSAWVAAIAGLWRSTDAGQTFAQVPGPDRMTFVGTQGSTLWAAGWYGGNMNTDGLASSTNAGDSFESVLAFPQVTEPVQCDAAAPTATTCEMLWKDWEYEILGMYDVYGGGPVPPGVGLPGMMMPSGAGGVGGTGGGPAPDAGTPSASGGSGGGGAAGTTPVGAGSGGTAGGTASSQHGGGCAVRAGDRRPDATLLALGALALWLTRRRRR